MIGDSNLPGTGFDIERLELAEALGGEIARDAVDAKRIGAIGRHLDIDHRIVETQGHRRRRADREVALKIDDAVMILRDSKLALGTQHAVRFDAADHALFEIDAGSRNMRAGGAKMPSHAGSRIGRAADDLDHAVLGLDIANAQAIGIGVLPRLAHARHREGCERLRLVLDGFDLEADTDQPTDDRVKRRIGLEIILEPGEREFHRTCLVLSSPACGRGKGPIAEQWER